MIATGARPRDLNLPGVALAGVHTLRRLDDADVLRASLAPGCRLVVIGAGWIGLEAAATARSTGCQVTVLESADIPLQRVLGETLGQHFATLHRRHGVDLRTGVHVSALAGAAGHVTAVQTDQGLLPAPTSS